MHLRPRQAAREIGVTTPVVRKLIKTGDLAAINVSAGGRSPRYRVPREALDRFLAARTTTSEGQHDKAQ